MLHDKDKITIALSFLLLLISFAILLTVYGKEGIGWDFTDHYLIARTLLNSRFYHQSLPLETLTTKANTTYVLLYFIRPGGIYISEYRGIVAPLIMVFSILISGTYSVQIYLFFLLALLLFASFFVSKELKINPLLVSAVLFAPYILRWTVLLNSTEALSLSIALLGIGLIAKKSSLSGMAFALVGLAKYTGMVLIPLPLLLFGRYRTIKAYLLYSLTTAPWLLFNYIYFGGPFLSYQLSYLQILPNSTPIDLVSLLLTILAYPLLILLLLFLVAASRHRKSIVDLLKRATHDRRYILVLSFIALAVFGLLLEYTKVGDPQRFGYLLYGGMALLIGLVSESSAFGSISLKLSNIQATAAVVTPYATYAVSLFLLILLYSSVLQRSYAPWLSGSGTGNPNLLNAVSNLTVNKINRCIVYSNAWPLLNYYNITTYVPEVCNASVLNYPIVLFRGLGTPDFCNIPINQSGIPRSLNYSIFTSGNTICQRG